MRILTSTQQKTDHKFHGLHQIELTKKFEKWNPKSLQLLVISYGKLLKRLPSIYLSPFHLWRVSWHLEVRNCDTNSKIVSSRLWGPAEEIILHKKFLNNLWKHFGWISGKGYEFYQWPLSIWKRKGNFCATLSCQNVRQDPCHARYPQSERGLCCHHEYGRLEQSIWPTMPETWGTIIYKKWC